MRPALDDGLMQVVGMSLAIVPLLVLAAGLAVASRRRRRAERVEASRNAN